MSPPPPKVTNEQQQDEEDVDDLDDFDELLDDFAAPPPPPRTKPRPQAATQAKANDSQSASSTSFEDELSRNMAALFASLGSAPPAPPASASASAPSTGPEEMSDDKESLELQNLFQQLLKGDPALASGAGEPGFGGLMGDGQGGEESLDALLASLAGSLGNPPLHQQQQQQQADSVSKSPTPSSASASTTANGKNKTPSSLNGESSSPTGDGGNGAKLSFEETIKQTMNNMKASEQESRSSGKQDSNDPLAALLASLNIDPSDLDLSSLNIPGLSGGASGAGGLGEAAGGGEDFSGLLDGMMKQLMTREILEEPLVELSEKYPAYLVANKTTLPPAQYAKYAEQSAVVVRIVEIFREDGYSDDDSVRRSEVTSLMTKMQDLGSPPDEIMGDMPEGLDFGGEGCSIM